MSKNNSRKNHKNKYKRPKNIPVLESATNTSHPLGIKLLEQRNSLTKTADKTFILAKLDKKLYLDKVRLVFSPMMLIPLIVSWIETPIHKLGAAPHVLQDTFPIILKTVEFCDLVMFWLQTSGFIQILYLIFSINFIQILFKHNKHNKQLQEKITPWLIIKMLFDLVLLYSSTKYFPGVMGSILAKATILFILLTIPYIIKLHHHQKHKGSFDPDRLLKKERRREKKRQKKKKQ